MDVPRSASATIVTQLGIQFEKEKFGQSLSNILSSFCLRNRQMGYCQGMNYLAMFILAVVSEEEKAFWVLCGLIERIFPPDFFSTVN